MVELGKDVKVSLKVMMNKERTKLLFAEADAKFAEIVLSFLELPLGKIVGVFKKHYIGREPVLGSLNTLYAGLSNLDSSLFWTNGGKKMLLNPRSSFANEPVKHFRCEDTECKAKTSPNVSIYYDTGICDCGRRLNRAMGAVEPKTRMAGDGIFVEGVSFLVTDDLKMAPYEPGYVSQALVDLGIVITEGAELRKVTLGYNEVMDLLKGSLLSKTPLTDTIRRVSNENSQYILEDLLDEMEPKALSRIYSNYKRMTVTAVMQESTNKLICVEAKEDFVDFILSFLTIPLGVVEPLLGNKTRFKGIDNLYNSAEKLIKARHLIKKEAMRRVLLEPELPPYYLSKNQIFPLSEQIIPPMYYCQSVTDSGRTIEKGFWMCCKDPKGDQGCYVKKAGKFVITDDLTIEPSIKCLRVLLCVKMAIPSSDVKEVEVKIGLKEGLSILKASLTSTRALTDGLIKPFLKMHSR